MTNTQIHHTIQQIDQQINENNHRRHQQYTTLHYQIITTLQYINQPTSQTKPRKNNFNQNHPHQQYSHLQTDNNHHRQHRITQHINDNHPHTN